MKYTSILFLALILTGCQCRLGMGYFIALDTDLNPNETGHFELVDD